jgi:hypothetical protein
MGQRIDDRELRRRALAGVRDEVEAFGFAALGFIEMWELRR